MIVDIYVLNRNFERVGVCDSYSSVLWITRYFSPGDFELYLPATNDNISLLKEDFYCVRDKDIIRDDDGIIYKNVMIIAHVQVITDIENGNYLTVTGRCLKSLLARRIIWQQTILSGSVETGIRRVVTENAINPTIPERKIAQLQLGQIKGFNDSIDKQATGDNLADFIAEVCTAYGLGWEVFIKANKFIFELYKGENRSYNQSNNPYVVFSQEFDNLLTTDYQYDKTNYKNVALVAGEGEGLNRRTKAVGTASGLDRYELFVDSRNSSSNAGEITAAEYDKMLEEEGRETLDSDENSILENISGEVEPSANYKFGEDYFLGDIVEVINEYGIETTPRITEIIESEDDNGVYTIPTFSTWEV